MKDRNWLILSFLLGLIWAVVTQVGDASLLTAPLWLIGNGLRWLSLSGVVGNLIAWGLVIVATIAPLIYLEVRNLGKRCVAADWLLPILSIQIGSLLYFLVNPTLTHYPAGLPLSDGFALMYGWGLVATAVGYVFLRVLKRVDLDATSGRLLPSLLNVGGLILVGLSSYNHLALLLIRIQSVRDANTGDVAFTVAVLSVLALCSLMPAVLGGMTLLWSGDVASALMNDPYGEETIALCGKTANWCNQVAVCTVLVTVGCNLAQILLASKLYQANITVELPLLTLLLSSALYLLCHYISGAKELADDNDSII